MNGIDPNNQPSTRSLSMRFGARTATYTYAFR
jgi:hypothetical protein